MNKRKTSIAVLVIGFVSILVPFVAIKVIGITSAYTIYGIHMGTAILLLFLYGWRTSGSLKEWLKEFI